MHDHPTMVGDCWRAAIACILEQDVEQVPHFVQMDEDGIADWWDASSEWLNERGYELLPQFFNNFKEDEFYLVTGKSPRGDFDHVVVYQNGKMVHDPHPSGDGIEDEKAFCSIRANPAI